APAPAVKEPAFVAAKAEKAAPVAKAKRVETAKPVAKPKAAAAAAQPEPRGAPIGLLLLLLVVVGSGAAFWFLYWRNRGEGEPGVTGQALPFKVKLDKGKTYKAHFAAPGHLAQDVELAGGKPVDVKLKSMPHVVHVTSKPGGAMIFVDGQPTRRTTPGDVDLT